MEQNQIIGKEIVEQKKAQSGRLCIQVFAEVECVNSNCHQTQVTNYGNNLNQDITEEQQDQFHKNNKFQTDITATIV